VIDHLDEDKANNAPANLVVACNPCNRARGAMLPFIAGMTEQALQVFIDRVMAYRLSVRT
jgi:5-methylcytosine-specific restriction endonuclease McrA